MAMTPAMESIFANAQQNAASLIETATLAINAKVNTIEEAEAMIQELSSEAVKFNELLTCIMNAMRQVESGDMQKEEAAGIIAPAVKELKDKCTALKIANVEAPGDDITEDEIATLRELIIGAKAAAEDRLVAIRLCDDCKVDPEVENELNPPEENGEAFEFDPATEGISSFIQKMHAKKIDKAKIEVLWDSFKDKKATAILSKFGKCASPMLLSGAEGKKVITDMVNEMKSADQKSGKDYTGKISAKDYIIASVNGVTMAILPGTTDGLGCSHIIAPVGNGKPGESSYEPEAAYFFKKEICSAMLNPIKGSEVTEAMEAYEEIAEEAAFLAHQYVNTTECKTAKALYQNAKKLYSMGSKEKALEYMKKAKDLYDKCLKKLLTESGKFEKAERVENIKKDSGTSAIRHNVTRTDSLTFAIARSKLETKIDRCTAHIMQWTDAGKETYQQTLDQLKADREQAKAAKKAAKAKNKNTEMEENTMENFNYSEFMFACESMMDELELDLATSYAMEADGEEGAEDAKAPSKIGAKLRSLFAKLKSAAKRGDKAEAEQINAEIKAEAENLEAAVDEAPEEKKDGLSKAAKVGLAAGAAALVAVTGMTIAGQAMQKKAAKDGTDPKGAAKAIISASNQVVKAMTAPGKAVGSAVTKVKADNAEVKNRVEMGSQGWAPGTKALKEHQKSIRKNVRAEQKARDRKAFSDKAKGVASTISSKLPKFGKKSTGEVSGTGDSMGYEAMEAYDIYELIMEAYDAAMDDDFQYDDVEFAAQLEAMM